MGVELKLLRSLLEAAEGMKVQIFYVGRKSLDDLLRTWCSIIVKKVVLIRFLFISDEVAFNFTVTRLS